MTRLANGRKAKLKATELREDYEGTWGAIRYAAEYVKKSQPTLRSWKVSCPLLGGKGICTKPFEGYTGQEDYFLIGPKDPKANPCSLDAVLAALANQEEMPACGGHTSIEDISQELGIRKETVWSRLRAMERSTKRVSAKRVCRRRKAGVRAERCKRSYVPNDVCDDLRKTFPAVRLKGKVTTKQAAESLSTDKCLIDSLVVLALIRAGLLEAEWSQAVNTRHQPGYLIAPERTKELKGALAKLSEDMLPGRRLRLAAERLAEQEAAIRTNGQSADAAPLIAEATAEEASSLPRPKRGRPTAKERHREWRLEHEQRGLSLTQIARKYRVTRRAVVDGIRKDRERVAREANSGVG